MFLYNGHKIKGAWNHDDGRSIPAGWVEDVTPEQLADYDVTEVADILPPVYNPLTQYITEQPDGSYITTDYTQTEIDEAARQKKVQNIVSKLLQVAYIQTELIDKLLSQGTIKSGDFTASVKQDYLDIKADVDSLLNKT